MPIDHASKNEKRNLNCLTKSTVLQENECHIRILHSRSHESGPLSQHRLHKHGNPEFPLFHSWHLECESESTTLKQPAQFVMSKKPNTKSLNVCHINVTEMSTLNSLPCPMQVHICIDCHLIHPQASTHFNVDMHNPPLSIQSRFQSTGKFSSSSSHPCNSRNTPMRETGTPACDSSWRSC